MKMSPSKTTVSSIDSSVNAVGGSASAGATSDSGNLAAMSKQGNDADAKSSNHVDSTKIAAPCKSDEVKVDTKESNQEEALLIAENKLKERINKHKCSKESCGANYVSANIYGKNGKNTGFCGPHFKEAFGSLSEEGMATHLEEKARAKKDRAGNASKASLKEGKTMVQHIHDEALADPEMPGCSVTNDGIVRFETGCFQFLIPILEALKYELNKKKNGKINKEGNLMDLLKGRYNWIPHKSMCSSITRRDDGTEKRVLKNGWNKLPVTFYAEDLDLSKQIDGKPNFGMDPEILRKDKGYKKNAKDRKAAAKADATARVVAEFKRSRTSWKESAAYKEALEVGVPESALLEAVKEVTKKARKSVEKKLKKNKSKTLAGEKENSNPMKTSSMATGKRKKSDEDDSDEDDDGGCLYTRRPRRCNR